MMPSGKYELTWGTPFSRVADAALVVTDREATEERTGVGTRVRRGTALLSLSARENIVG